MENDQGLGVAWCLIYFDILKIAVQQYYDPSQVVVGRTSRKAFGARLITSKEANQVGRARLNAAPQSLNYLQTFCMSLAVAELFDCLLAGPVLRTVMQYSTYILQTTGSS